MSSLSDAIKEAYSTAPSNVVTLDTLEISHPLLEETFYLVKNYADLELTLEDSSVKTFEGLGFNISLPKKDDSGLQELNISIDNVDRRLTDFINTVKLSLDPVVVKYRPYLSSDLTQPQMNPPLLLFMRDLTVSLTEVTGKANFADIINRKFPSQIYTRKRFPSLGG